MGTRLLLGMAAGAGLLYFFDPQSGRRRRTLLRDQITKFQNQSSRQLDATVEMAADRAQGAVAEAARHVMPGDASDETLVARVRSELGRYVSHPRSVDVSASDGSVTLRGHILSKEIQPFVAKVKGIPGVKSINNQLTMHDRAENIPELQGGRTRTELR